MDGSVTPDFSTSQPLLNPRHPHFPGLGLCVGGWTDSGPPRLQDCFQGVLIIIQLA